MITGRKVALLLSFALLGCAQSFGGVATDSRATWAKDCGTTEDAPNMIPVLNAQRASPNSVMIKASDIPAGMLGILKSDECVGAAPGGAKVQVVRQSVQVVRLIPPKDITPQAASAVIVCGIEEIPPSEWHKYRR